MELELDMSQGFSIPFSDKVCSEETSVFGETEGWPGDADQAAGDGA